MKKLIILLSVLMLAGVSLAGTKYIPYYFGGTDLDSVMIIKYNIASPARDTTIVKSFPVEDSFTVDNTKDYKVRYQYFYTGDTTIPSLVSTEIIPLSKYSSGYTYTHVVKIIDTSDNTTPDSALAYIRIAATNASGSNVGSGQTDALGYEAFSLDSGSYTFSIFYPPYQADQVTDTITASGDTTIIRAYDNGTSTTCRVWGYIKGVGLNGVYGGLNRIPVKFTPPAIDFTSDSSMFYTDVVETHTDTAGYFAADIPKSSYMGDQKWTAAVGTITKTFTVPDSSSYHLAFRLK